jgi:hypothetical protein
MCDVKIKAQNLTLQSYIKLVYSVYIIIGDQFRFSSIPEPVIQF